MIDDYKNIVDKITAGEELQNITIMKIRDKANNKLSSKKKNIHIYKISALTACFLIAVFSLSVFYNSIFPRNSSGVAGKETSQVEKAPEVKTTMTYAPGSVQARIMTEKPDTADGSATVDLIAPAYKNIQQIYAGSETVVKGYVYSTEYIWYTSGPWTQLYTKSVIYIEKSYKGEHKAGEKVTVIESGGVTTLKEWIEKTSVKEYKDFEQIPENYDPYNGKSPDTLMDCTNPAGIAAMRTGQDVVLFLALEPFEFLLKNNEPAYRLIQFDAGKMVLNNGVYQPVLSSGLKPLVEVKPCAAEEIDNFIKKADSEANTTVN